MRLRALFACCLALALATGAAIAQDLQTKVDPWVMEKTAAGKAEFLVMLREQADLRGARTLPTKNAEERVRRGRAAPRRPRATQAPVRALLDARGAEYRAYWVANMIWVRGDREPRRGARGARGRVSRLRQPVGRPARTGLVEASRRRARFARRDRVGRRAGARARSLGARLQGPGHRRRRAADTGYQWDHPALKLNYRGWNGTSADHNYNWHDAIHSGGGSCGADSQAPCDDFGHGTHTMGTMVGDDGGNNKIGVAPAAKWIGCRNMDQGAGTPATYTECFQWFIAPTDLANAESRSVQVAATSSTTPGAVPRRGLHGPGSSCRRSSRTRARRASRSSSRPATAAARLRDREHARGDLRRVLLGRRDGHQRRHRGLLEPRPGHRRRQQPPEAGHLRPGRERALEHSRRRVRLLERHEHGGPARRRRRRASSSRPTPSSSATRTRSSPCSRPPPCRARRPRPAAACRATRSPTTRTAGAASTPCRRSSADLGLTQTASPSPTLVGVPVTFTVTVSNLGPGVAIGTTLSEGLSITATVDSATPSQGSCTVLAARHQLRPRVDPAAAARRPSRSSARPVPWAR